MSRLVATIDLSAANVGSSDTFATQTPNACSALYVMNESACFIQLDLGSNGQPIVQPWRNRLFYLPQAIQNAQWTVIAVLQSGGSPASAVYVEAFAPNETPPAGTLDGPVFRQSNIGNSVPVGTSSSAVTNDGAAAGTVVVEGTPTGASSSQAKLTNDGDFTCGGGLFHINNAGVVTAIPAGAIPASALASGYPASHLGAGTLAAGVTVPAGQVASGYPAANLGAGNLPAGVVVGAAATVASVIGAFDNGTGQLHSTVNARGMALGYNDVGGTYHQVLGVDASGNTTAGGAFYWSTQASGVDASGPQVSWNVAGRHNNYYTPLSGAAAGHVFVTWDGTAEQVPFGIGAAANGSKSYVDDSGNLFTRRITPAYGGSLAGVAKISGSASATVNHGLGTTPDAAVVNTANGSNSTTFGSGAYTATTVFIYQFSAMAWVGLVYVH